MNFLNPFFLFGLLAIGIPVIIHLVNLRRPRKISFSTLAFLNELKKSTIKRIRIKKYFLMALRAFAILLLALALARPFLLPTLSGSSSSNAPKTIAILVDNSPSMSRIGQQGPLIDQAKDIVASIINSSRRGDRFVIAATNGASENLSLTSAARALELAQAMETSNTGNYAPQALKLLYNRVQQSPQEQGIIYIVSDGQQSQLKKLESFKITNTQNSKPVALQWVKLGNANQQNLAIADIQLKSQMLSKGSTLQLAVTVKNTGTAAASNQFLSLQVEQRMVGEYQTTLEPGQSQEFIFELSPDTTGDIVGKVVLEGDEVSFDNTRYFVLRVPDSRSVLLINQTNRANSEFVSYLSPALKAAQQSNTQIAFTEEQVDEASQLNWSNFDVVVLDGLQQIPEYWFTELQRYVQQGHGVLFFPSEKGNIANYNAFLDLFNAGSYSNVNGEYSSFKTVGSLAPLVVGHPVLDDLFDKKEEDQISLNLPDLFFYYTYKSSGNTGAYNILSSEDGLPILAEQRFGNGKILVSSIGMDPGWSNFPVNPLFAPFYYRSILYAASSEQGGMEEHVLGNPFEWEGDISSADIELAINQYTIRPEVQPLTDGIRISYPGQPWSPGILQINSKNEKRKVAVNQHIMESDFETLEDQQFKKMFQGKLVVNDVIKAQDLSNEQIKDRLTSASFGKEIWNWLIWLAVIILVIESLVSRLYKAETNS